MSDLISRQAAMEYPLSWEHYDKEHGDSKFICGVESYREYIEHLPSVDEWTPCSERLPEIDRDEWTGVFATVMSEHDKEIRWVRELVYDENGTWCYPTGETYDQIVVAWIPKPEPYKGGK